MQRVPYELCALAALRDAIRRREVWIVGARRWLAPESDLPADFEEHRDLHYATAAGRSGSRCRAPGLRRPQGRSARCAGVAEADRSAPADACPAS